MYSARVGALSGGLYASEFGPLGTAGGGLAGGLFASLIRARALGGLAKNIAIGAATGNAAAGTEAMVVGGVVGTAHGILSPNACGGS